MSPVVVPNRKALDFQITLAEQKRQTYVFEPEAGTKFEELLNPLFWSNVGRFRPGDKIVVHPPGMSWYAELLVQAVEPRAVKVRKRFYEEYDAPEASDAHLPDVPEGFEVKFRGKAGWCVVRIADNEVLFKEMRSRSEAVLRLEQHVKVLAA